MILAQDILRLDERHTKSLTDADIRTSCPACKGEVFLSDASVAEEDMGTVYRCPVDNERLVVITRPLEPDTRPRLRGYRFGNFILRNASDLAFRLHDTPPPTRWISLPASPDAFRGL